MGIHSRAEVERRVADIYGLVVDGMPLAAVRRFVASNCIWTASDRTLCRYIARARARMLEEAKQGREEAFAQSLARKQRLYTRASVAKQLKTALAVQNAIDRMYGDFAHEQEGDMNAVDRFLAALKEGETSPEGR